MVPGPSIKELAPEPPNPNQDGVSQIIFAQLFKPGETEYSRVGSSVLKNAPPLPTGFTLFKDLVYEVKTQAIITAAFNITVFNVPSAETEREFKNLAVLHLEDDEMSPTGKSWNDATLFPETADERVFHFIPKAKYDSLQPDFQSKRIAAVTDQFGIFAIALAPESESERSEPFPQVVVEATSSPEPVQAGKEVTHTITVKNKGTTAAAEVNVKEVLDIELDYVSATPNQGVCKQKVAANNIVCHLGALTVGASATITVVSRTLPNLMEKDVIELSNPLEVVFKQSPTDFVDARGQIHTQFRTTILKRP